MGGVVSARGMMGVVTSGKMDSPGWQAAKLHSYVTRTLILCVAVDVELAKNKGVGTSSMIMYYV